MNRTHPLRDGKLNILSYKHAILLPINSNKTVFDFGITLKYSIVFTSLCLFVYFVFLNSPRRVGMRIEKANSLFSLIRFIYRRSFGQCKGYFASRKKQVPFSMAIGNAELVLECFPKHSLIGTARIKT